MSDDALDRPSLRSALLEAEPWLADPARGPRAVDAGACDRCGELPRLLPTCGPAAAGAVCRPCAVEAGLDAWCDGHREEGREALRWALRLPAHWDVAVSLWWVATGELRAIEPRALRRAPTLPDGLRELLDQV
jgi:hypothetical protein